jgi:hypothetical protein
MNKLTWTNYGDVNPLDHGAIWLSKDEETENCYHIIRWEPETDESGMFSNGYIDLSDNWFELQSIADYADWNLETTKEQRAMDIFSYYGCENFGGKLVIIDNREELVKMLTQEGVEV